MSTVIDNGLEGLNSTSGGGNAAYARNQFFGNNAGGAQISGGVIIGCNMVAGGSSCP